MSDRERQLEYLNQEFALLQKGGSVDLDYLEKFERHINSLRQSLGKPESKVEVKREEPETPDSRKLRADIKALEQERDAIDQQISAKKMRLKNMGYNDDQPTTVTPEKFMDDYEELGLRMSARRDAYKSIYGRGPQDG